MCVTPVRDGGVAGRVWVMFLVRVWWRALAVLVAGRVRGVRIEPWGGVIAIVEFNLPSASVRYGGAFPPSLAFGERLGGDVPRLTLMVDN